MFKRPGGCTCCGAPIRLPAVLEDKRPSHPRSAAPGCAPKKGGPLGGCTLRVGAPSGVSLQQFLEQEARAPVRRGPPPLRLRRVWAPARQPHVEYGQQCGDRGGAVEAHVRAGNGTADHRGRRQADAAAIDPGFPVAADQAIIGRLCRKAAVGRGKHEIRAAPGFPRKR